MLSVVVPTFNEGKNIRNLVTQINDALKGIDYEILFVDDSKDNTPEVIMEVAKDFPQVRMEHRTGETGLATAVLKGFELAKGEYMACMDAVLVCL
jgi:dolichol-phosphate mannosyltransferase